MRPVTAKWPQPPEKSTIDPRRAPAQSSPSPAGFGKMSKEAQLSVAERDFILEALRENVRLDGRGTDEFRPLNLSFGDEYGHVKLQVGKTRLVPYQWPLCKSLVLIFCPSIVVRISAEVTKPRDDRPFDGLFNINLELSAMGSPAWENGR